MQSSRSAEGVEDLTDVQKKMMDIHMHLVPNVDDGAADQVMAIRMMLQARDQGIAGIFATPHSSAFDNDPEQVMAGFSRIKKQAALYFPEMELYLGCEVYCDAYHTDEVVQSLSRGRYPTMNGTKYVLLEFSMWTAPEEALRCVEAVAGAGWIPIIAHMERYRFLRRNMELVDRIRELGGKIQINAYSLYDEMDESIRAWARMLVQQKIADFLGTDAHRTYHRPPCAEKGIGWLYENCPDDYADALVFGNARKYLTESNM